MMHVRITLFSFFVTALACLLSFGVVFAQEGDETSSDTEVTAQSVSERPLVTYPIEELGGCESRGACKAYCDILENANACLIFAESHKLLPQEKIDEGRKIVKAGKEGPGGCTSRVACAAYCARAEHFNECIEFGEKHDILPPQASERAKLVLAAIRQGERLPGGCRTKEECDAYCEIRENVRQCLVFAEKAGLIREADTEKAGKFVLLMESGETPGGCTSKEACRLYCSDAAHRDECALFAEEQGLLSPDRALEVRTALFEGPGGCTSKEACAAYCNLPEHHDECLTFAAKKNLLQSTDLVRVKSGVEKVRDEIATAPPQVSTCVRGVLDPVMLERIENGAFLPPREVADRIHDCFDRGASSTPGNLSTEKAIPARPIIPKPPVPSVDCEMRVKAAVTSGALSETDAVAALLRCRGGQTGQTTEAVTIPKPTLPPAPDCAAKVRMMVSAGTVTEAQAVELLIRCKAALPQPYTSTDVAPVTETVYPPAPVGGEFNYELQSTNGFLHLGSAILSLFGLRAE